jgi:hypothetical protein
MVFPRISISVLVGGKEDEVSGGNSSALSRYVTLPSGHGFFDAQPDKSKTNRMSSQRFFNFIFFSSQVSSIMTKTALQDFAFG